MRRERQGKEVWLTTRAAGPRSKGEFIIQCGFRRFVGSPLFSAHSIRANKHKLERFLHPGRICVATMYAPACYTPAPTLFLQHGGPSAEATGERQSLPPLVASGSVLGCDADRVIVKKIVLTGYPFRVHKRKAVIRWMFFNPDDVRWFKPIELHTKMGRVGHILEPLGTHGYYKAIFDGPLQPHDTVCMNLYKRVFPTWGRFRFTSDGERGG